MIADVTNFKDNPIRLLLPKGAKHLSRVCESAKIFAGPQSGGPTRVLSDLLKYVTFQKLHKYKMYICVLVG